MLDIPFVDTHVHFYDLRRNDLVYSWLQPDAVHPQIGDINAIKTLVYSATAFQAESRFANVTSVVHVQAAIGAKNPVAETIWLEEMAEKDGCPDAIVAAADLAAPDVEEVLARHLAASNRVRGIRDFGQGDYLASPDWRRGYSYLEKFDLLCDLDCTWETMETALQVARLFPGTLLVVEHAGFPRARTPEYFREWHNGLAKIAKAENVWCKISGLGMGDPRWTVQSLRPWVEACLELFGVERCFFGSNWPVDRLFSSYDAVVSAYDVLTTSLSRAERESLFFRNANFVYRLE